MADINSSQRKENWFGRHRYTLLIAGPLILLIVTVVAYLLGGRVMSTDDATIQAARVQISTTISGRVTAVAVHDNQYVHKGDPLLMLDERPLRIAIEEATAQLAAAKLQVRALRATYRQRQADQQAAGDALAYQQRELDRQKLLAASGISSKSQLDQAQNNLDQARSRVNAIDQQMANILANLGGTPDLPIEQQPTVQQAQATLDRARLNLTYAVLPAPMDGIVTKVEQLQVGDYITQGSPQFALVSSKDLWVEANFKEDQLTYMRPGQQASFTIDTYPGHHFTGKVTSISPGTGSTYSLLPPENASGNWVKIVQRLALRLAIDPTDVPLYAGLSVTAHVDTEHRRSLLFWRDEQ